MQLTPPPTPRPGPEPEDLLAMGEERSPRWRRLGIPVAVALVAAGGYQLVSGPSSQPAGPAAAAENAAQPVVVESWVPAVTGDRQSVGSSAPTVRLGGEVVALQGPGLGQPHRETSVAALGRLDGGWLVAVTSRACHDRTDSQETYGTALASGRFAPWEAVPTRRGAWRSPDRTMVLLEAGPRLVLRRTATDRVVGVFRP